MHRRTARGNRIGLAVVGVLTLLAGAALLAANRGWIANGHRSASIYPPRARGYVHDHGSWLWPVIAAAAIVVGLVFLRWLLVQPRTDALSGLVVDGDSPGPMSDDGAGRTTMPAHAVTDIVEDDVAGLHGVRRVTARLSGHRDAPELWLRVVADADADIARIRTEISAQVVPDARTCLDLPELPTYLRLAVSGRSGDRQVR